MNLPPRPSPLLPYHLPPPLLLTCTRKMNLQWCSLYPRTYVTKARAARSITSRSLSAAERSAESTSQLLVLTKGPEPGLELGPTAAAVVAGFPLAFAVVVGLGSCWSAVSPPSPEPCVPPLSDELSRSVFRFLLLMMAMVSWVRAKGSMVVWVGIGEWSVLT